MCTTAVGQNEKIGLFSSRWSDPRSDRRPRSLLGGGSVVVDVELVEQGKVPLDGLFDDGGDGLFDDGGDG